MDAANEVKIAKLKHDNPGITIKKLTELTGETRSSIDRYNQRVKRLARKGYAPEYDMTHQVPDGYVVKGVSTLYPATEDTPMQWVKSDIDKTKTLEDMMLAVEAILEPVKGKHIPVESPTGTASKLMSVYPVVDAHVGLYSWKEETGQDWDATKSEKALNGCMQYLVNAAPASDTCLIPNLGDFFHTDDSSNQTQRSGHALDVDTRWAKVFQIGVRCYRNLIIMALKKHKKVYVKSGIGNHDDHSILSLAMMMQAYFENEPRVEIELPISQFAYHRFGTTLIGINHGLIKADRLPLIMAHDQREKWGKTKFHHWFVGHLHQASLKEFPGCIVEGFRGQGGKDAWTVGMGYRSLSDMQLIVFHEKKGEVSRTRISPDSL